MTAGGYSADARHGQRTGAARRQPPGSSSGAAGSSPGAAGSPAVRAQSFTPIEAVSTLNVKSCPKSPSSAPNFAVVVSQTMTLLLLALLLLLLPPPPPLPPLMIIG